MLDSVMNVAQVILIIAGLASLVLAPLRLYVGGPRIEIRPIPWNAPTPWAFAQVEIRNRPLPSWASWAMARESAVGASVEIEFSRNGTLVVGPIPARWSDRPEPFHHEIDHTTGQLLAIYDPALAVESKWWNLPPTRRGFGLAVAILRRDDTAHGWGAESYAYPDWRHPRWALQHGDYEVTIRVSWSDRDIERTFRLPYRSADFDAFHLR